MRHQVKKGRKLGRTKSHRDAMFRNMVVSFIKAEKIETTVQKAKELRSIAEKLVTRSKDNTLHNRREAAKTIKDKSALVKLFEEIGPRFKERPGGYTRIIKTGFRKGDSAQMAIIEFVDQEDED